MSDRYNEWLEQRRHHIGGSEIASLFEDFLARSGEKPRVSKFELWHQKVGNIEPDDLSGNDRVLAGTFLESAVCKWVEHETGWKLQEADYLSNGKGLGGTPDRIIHAEGRGPGILEVKTVDWLVFRDWVAGKPPLAYQLQLQDYIGLSGCTWGAIAFLVGGNDLRIVEYQARPAVFAEIEKRSRAFWDSIARGIQPEMTEAEDLGLYLSTMRALGENLVVWNGHQQVDALLAEHFEVQARIKADEERGKWIKKELADLLAKENARKGQADSASITLVEVSPVEPTLITQEMVGQPIGGRKGSSYLKITPKKVKKNDE